MFGGGGQALVGKWGEVPDRGGGIDQIFTNWGDPQSPLLGKTLTLARTNTISAPAARLIRGL